MKVYVGGGKKNKWLNFGGDPDYNPAFVQICALRVLCLEKSLTLINFLLLNYKRTLLWQPDCRNVGLYLPKSGSHYCQGVHLRQYLGGDKGVCLPLHTHTNPWGRLKWPSTTTRLTAHFVCGLMSDMVICKFRKGVVMHDTECPFWD